MFASIRRHQKWLWFVISVLTIISFVAFFSPRSQRGASYGAGLSADDTVGSIYGRRIRRDEYAQASREANLRYFITYRRWADDDEMARQLGLIDRETRNRLLLIRKLDEMNVKVGETAVAQWIADAFQDPATKTLNLDFYNQFVKEMLPKKIGMQPKDFETFVKHEVGIQHLMSVLGIAGRLVTPQEAETAYRRENEQVDTKIVLIPSSNYLAKVTMDPAAIAGYYTNQQSSYRTPERMLASYVKYDVTNFLAAADLQLAKDTNKVSARIDAEYQQRGADFYKGPTGQPLAPAEAKQRIRDDIRRDYARIEAQKKATEFMEKLFDLKPASQGNIEKLAAATGLQSAVTPPFSQFQAPPGLAGLTAEFSQAAFRLTAEEPFLDQPVVTDNAVYVFGLKARVASAVPPLEQIQTRVANDFQKSQAKLLVGTAGAELQRALNAALAQGKSFDAAVAESKASVIDLSPFSQKTTSVSESKAQPDFSSIKNVAFALAPGKVSEFNPGRDGGFIVYLEKRVPAGDDQVKAGLAEELKTLRQNRQYEAFSDWLRSEMESAAITLDFEKKTKTASK
jgi:hypothetical protein